MASSPSDDAPQRGLAVLVVEDEILISLEIEDLLERNGCRVVGPAPTVASALALIEEDTPEAAVLDVDLRGERVTPVAAALRRRGIPYVLASACGRRQTEAHPELDGVENIGKPMHPLRLIECLTRMACGRHHAPRR
jgi:two-component system, response regulator PdtaR